MYKSFVLTEHSRWMHVREQRRRAGNIPDLLCKFLCGPCSLWERILDTQGVDEVAIEP